DLGGQSTGIGGRRQQPELRASVGSAPSESSFLSFEAAGQLLQAQSRAGLVVLRPQAWRQVLAYQRDFRAAGHLFERRNERHLAQEGRIVGDEADGFDDPA